MKLLNLNGLWTLRGAGLELQTQVPGSVAAALVDGGHIPHPYESDNESKAWPWLEESYVFSRSFRVAPEQLLHDRVELCCEGLDTLCSLEVNGVALGDCDNMHRTWVFPVKELLHPGENTLAITFHSARKYVQENPARVGKPFSVIRKAACMFGWDWGLNLPDMGIWRDIYLRGFDGARIDHVVLSQTHRQGKVTLNLRPQLDSWTEAALEAALYDPEGQCVFRGSIGPEASIDVENPRLWWPVGFGDQSLYTLEVRAVKAGRTLDTWKKSIGLRTIHLDRAPDGEGARYAFRVNGREVFFRGENLIIPDAILSHFGEDRWRQLLQDCVHSNLNGIRVWGGAIYPPDIFFDLCDRLGLLVFQDMMFACSFYAVSEAFLENVRQEVVDNLKRIAHHSCICLYCGNNEIDGIYTVTGSTEPRTVALRRLFGSDAALPEPVRQMLWQMYEPLFCRLLPGVCKVFSPDTDYVSSSPCGQVPGKSESFFDYTRDGDMHYYLQYDGNLPYQSIRDLKCRFITEMGFQSYPNMETIRYFTREEDRSPYSPVMYAHQKCFRGNETIELYLDREYGVPRDFEDYVYLSQLQAGEILRYSVEHFRWDSGYCRGMILWQLNDCWPVVSWSGVDYFGRWKLQQYFIRRFYESVLISAREEGTNAEIWVSNESADHYRGTARWRLCHADGRAVREGAFPVELAPAQSICAGIPELGLTEETAKNHILCYSLEESPWQSVLLCPAREFRWQQPEITLVRGDGSVTVRSDCYVKGFTLETDAVLSDNGFDLIPGAERTVTPVRGTLEETLSFRCLNQVMARM